MNKTTLTFEEIDDLLAILEMTHADQISGDLNALYDKLSEMRDEV